MALNNPEHGDGPERFISSERLIAYAHRLEPDHVADIRYPKDALDAIWGHGGHDEDEGTVSEWPFKHVFRVANWLLWTDDQGFTEVEVLNNSDDAEQVIVEWLQSLEQD